MRAGNLFEGRARARARARALTKQKKIPDDQWKRQVRAAKKELETKRLKLSFQGRAELFATQAKAHGSEAWRKFRYEAKKEDLKLNR